MTIKWSATLSHGCTRYDTGNESVAQNYARQENKYWDYTPSTIKETVFRAS